MCAIACPKNKSQAHSAHTQSLYVKPTYVPRPKQPFQRFFFFFFSGGVWTFVGLSESDCASALCASLRTSLRGAVPIRPRPVLHHLQLLAVQSMGREVAGFRIYYGCVEAALGIRYARHALNQTDLQVFLRVELFTVALPCIAGLKLQTMVCVARGSTHRLFFSWEPPRACKVESLGS